MTDTTFEQLPGSARIWIFGTERSLTEADRALLLGSVDDFLAQWKAHGAPLAAGRAWLHERFLVVAVDERVTPPSGCSIDALVHSLKRLQTEIGVRLVDNAPVYFRSDRGVERVSRGEFGKLAEAGVVSPDTTVFDNSITRMADFRSGGWEAPARDRWHGAAFFESMPSS